MRTHPALYRHKTFSGTSIHPQQRLISPWRTTTTSSILLQTASSNTSVAGEQQTAAQQTALAWRQVYEETPVSFGITCYDGYAEMIPPRTRLPSTKTQKFVSAFDYLHRASFGICYRRTMLDVPTEFASHPVLENIRMGKKGVAHFKVTMRIDPDLTGNVTFWDTWTRSRISVDFDGGIYCHVQPERPMVISGPS